MVFLTIDAADSLAVAAAFIEDNNYAFTVLLDTNSGVSTKYGILGVPTTFFIDKDGIIQKWKLGAYLSTAEIEADLRSIIP